MDQAFTEDEKILLAFRRATKLARRKAEPDTPTQNASTGTSVTAAFARSFVLLLGVYFKRPSRLYRPTRVDTLTTLRQMALSANQSLSPSFIRSLVKDKGPRAILQNILPPLLINTALGTLLFTSHSYFCYLLSRLDFFAPKPLPHPHLDLESDEAESSLFDRWTSLAKRGEALSSIPDASGSQQDSTDDQVEEDSGPVWLSFNAEDQITFMESIHRLPHPTLLSALAGAAAGAIQGVAFAPIENAVKLLQRGITSWSEAFSRVFGFKSTTSPFRPIRALGLPKSPQEVKQFFGVGEGVRKAWAGVKYAIVRDAIGYALFFSTFDISRRVGLAVKAWLTPDEQLVLVGDQSSLVGSGGLVDEYGLHPKAPTKARLAQAACLVTGGISASFLAEYATRPMRRIEELAKLKHARAPGLEFEAQAKPTRIRGLVRPFQSEVLPLIRSTLRKEGLRGFFKSPAEMRTPLSDRPGGMTAPRSGKVLERVKIRLTRVGWRLVAVGPHGLAFLVFAYLGGEV